jgi:hypothetical protein|tara:strand:- start:6227 stop:6364 length:138 start_codon:yes stop_codon:yes gene_type:complete
MFSEVCLDKDSEQRYKADILELTDLVITNNKLNFVFDEKTLDELN